MPSVWSSLASVARGVLQDALAGRPPAGRVSQLARTNIERARAELRLGDPGAGDALLVSTIERLTQSAENLREGHPERNVLDTLRAVALSVRAQGFEHRGRSSEARDVYAQAIGVWADLPDELLTARDRSDYGVALAATGQDEAARPQLEAAREQRGETPEATRHLARIMLESNEIGMAERLLDETLQAVPSDPDAHLLLARARTLQGHPAAAGTLQTAALLLLDAGRAEEARQVLEAAVGSGAADHPTILLHAEALRQEGRIEEALVGFERGLLVEPESVWLLGRYASVLHSLGRDEQAKEKAEEALATAPDDVTALVLRGNLELGQENLSEAFSYAERALAADPREPTAYQLKARAHLARGSTGAALNAVQAGRALAPQDHDLLRLHADIEIANDSSDSAIELLRTICALPTARPDDYWRYADLLANADDFVPAIEVAAEASRRWPHDVRLIELHGDLLRRAGRIAESITLMTEATAADPTSARAWLLLGLAHHENQADKTQPAQPALDAMARAAELDPGWADPHWLQAEIWLDANQRGPAHTELDVALKRNPDHVPARCLLAQLHLNENRPADAEAVIRKALAVEPLDAAATVLLAQAQLARGRAHKVLRTLADDPAERTSDPGLVLRWLLVRGIAHTEMHQWDAAQEDLTAVIEARPDQAEAWFRRAEMFRLRGDTERALQDIEQAIIREPDYTEAWGARGAVLASAGRTAEAREALNRALDLDPNYTFGLQILAQVTAPGDPAQAHELLKRAIRIRPEDRQLRLEEAWLDVTDGRYEEALDRFDHLLEPTPDAEAYAGRAEALRLLGKAPDAVEAAERAVALDPDDAQAIRSLGFALLADDRPEQAVEVFNRAVELYPADLRAKVDLALACEDNRVDDLDRAVTLLTEACAERPEDPWPLSVLARVALDVGLYQDAAHLFRRVLDVNPGDETSYSGLGWALQFVDPPELAAAEQIYRNIRKRLPDDLGAGKNLADVLHAQGRTEEARRLYRSVLTQAEALRNERPDALHPVGWCAFRLQDFTLASRAMLEVVSTLTRVTGADFDLALVQFCDPESEHGVEAYRTAVQALEERHPQARRSILIIARKDLTQALVDVPALAGHPNAGPIATLLAESLAQVPPPPTLSVVADP